MGGSASTAGGRDGPLPAAAVKPEEDWVLENVLFFDPTKQTTQREGALAAYKGPTVRRFTPSRAKLRNRNFRVFFTIEGRRQEYLLKLLNDPICRILLCDRSGRELKEIRTSHIKYMQRQDVAAEVYVKTERGDIASLSFEFENSLEAELFGEFVITLFGIRVHFFGTQKIEKARPLDLKDSRQSSDVSEGGYDSDEEQQRETERMPSPHKKPQQLPRSGCPLHGNQACRCVVERPNLDFVRNKKYADDSSEEEDEEKANARHAARYPIAIEGPCECGREVRVNDIGGRGVCGRPASVVEWFVASQPGRERLFPAECEAVGRTFRLKQRHVGKYIQVRASRRLEGTEGPPFVYSLAIKGPVTIDDETARAMLLMLTMKEKEFEATCKGPDLQRLFCLSPVAVATNQPFFDITLTVTRQALQLGCSLPSLESPLLLEMHYNAFYISLIPPEEIDNREEDLRLRLHFPSYSHRKNVFELVTAEVVMPSEETKKNVFHIVCFYRLQGKKGCYDRWARDLERGDYSFIKTKYSRLWAETPWGVYASIEGTKPQQQETLTPVSYAQQLLKEYQHANADN